MANPGSSEAKRLGCICPVLDNSFGDGAIVDGVVDPNQYYLDPSCPIHADRRRLEDDRPVGGGEDHPHGHDGAEAEPGDNGTTYLAPADSEQPAREDGGVAELPEGTGRRDEVQGDRAEKAE